MKMSARLALVRDFLVDRRDASASAAPIPIVLPEKSTDSTSARFASGSMCGAMSSAVSSLRDFPAREKAFVEAMV